MNYFIDIDDTMIRSIGTKRIPITDTIKFIKNIDTKIDSIYLWSRGGAEYTKEIADSLGIAHLISGFLPKPDVMIDDQRISDWAHLKQLYPTEI
jgi:hypothetical protein